jgi:hypothetical protein
VTVRSAETGDVRKIATVNVRRLVDERERKLLGETGGRSLTLVAVDEGGRMEAFRALSTPRRDDDERTAEIAATHVEPSRWRTGPTRPAPIHIGVQ